MLCPEYRDICTNRCEKIQTCSHRHSHSHQKVSFLVKTVDILVSEIEPQILDGIPVITYRPYCITKQSTEQGILDEMSPTIKNPTFYSDLISEDSNE